MSSRVSKPAITLELFPGRPLILEASAGTGKTYALEHLVVELLLVHHLSPREILLVTFTEKATRELRTRVLRTLDTLSSRAGRAAVVGPHWELSGAARERLARARADFASMTITTIHAFAKRVLDDEALSLGLPLSREQVSTDALFDEAYTAVLARASKDHDLLSELLRAGILRGPLVATMRAILFDVLRTHDPLLPEFSRERFVQAVTGVHALPREEILKALGTLPIHANIARALSRHATLLFDAVKKFPEGERELATVLWELDRVRTSLTYVVRTEHACASHPAAAAFARAVRILDDARVAPKALLAIFLAPRVREALSHAKRARGTLDFDDMLQGAHHAISADNTSVAARLRARYRALLIDEFQDTDAVQWDLFRTLFLQKPEGRFLVVVGDPKQAIYQFRGADLAVYHKATGELCDAGGRVRSLTQNYRSSVRLVTAYNQIFDNSFFTGGQTYEPQTAERKELRLQAPTGEELPSVVLLDASEASPKDWDSLVTSTVAHEILRLISKGGPCVSDSGTTRPLVPEDIFLLTRTLAEGDALAGALARSGIAHHVVRDQSPKESEEALCILDLLRAVAEPWRQGLVLRALLSPFFGASVCTAEQGIADAIHTATLLHELVAEGHVSAFANHALHLLAVRGVARERYELLFAELVRAWDGRPIDPKGLCRAYEEAVRAPATEAAHETSKRGVSILTMHKAKGLEAPVVFVCGGYRGSPREDVAQVHLSGQRVTVVAPLPESIRERRAQDARAEEERLLYVALTRARVRLYVPTFASGGEVRSPAYAELERRLLSRAGTSEWTEPLYAIVPMTKPTHGGPLAAEAMAPVHTPAALPIPSPRPAPWVSSLRGSITTSYTRLSLGKEVRDLPLDEDTVGPRGAEVGIALHAALERVRAESVRGFPFEAWCKEPDVQTLFTDKAFSGFRTEAMQMVYRALTAPLPLESGACPLSSLRIVGRELPFVFPHSGMLIRGAVDLVFEHEGRHYVVDYKSDSVTGLGDADLMAYATSRYGTQATIYMEALRRTLASGAGDLGGIFFLFLRLLDPPPRGIIFLPPGREELRL